MLDRGRVVRKREDVRLRVCKKKPVTGQLENEPELVREGETACQ